MSAIVLRHPLFLDASQVVFDSFMPVEVFSETVLVQIGFQAENLLCDFLILTLDALQLSLSLIEVQALCFELDIGDGVALAEAARRQVDRRLLAR